MTGPDFSEETKRTLSNQVNGRCSNPECVRGTRGPHSDEGKAVNIGEAAHIHGARPGTARYDEGQTDDARSAIENGIWLCRNCHKRIDADEERFPVDLLRSWKLLAKERTAVGRAPLPASNPIIEARRLQARQEALVHWRNLFLTMHDKSVVEVTNNAIEWLAGNELYLSEDAANALVRTWAKIMLIRTSNSVADKERAFEEVNAAKTVILRST